MSNEESEELVSSSPERASFLKWQSRISKEFDPNQVSDPGGYVTVSDSKEKDYEDSE